MISKVAGKKQKIDPMRKKLLKEVDLGEPTSFLDPCFFRLYSTRMSNKQRFCGQLKKYVLNPESVQELKRSYLIQRNLAQTFPHGLVIWKGMQRNVWSDIANWWTEQTQQLYKVATPCLDDHQFEEEMQSVGELSVVCSQIVLKCLHLARIGRPDILWSVNKLERAVTKWTRVCDKRLARLISYIHHTSEFKQDCHVGKHYRTMQVGTVSGLWFCWRSCRLTIELRRTFVHIWKSYIRTNKLDVQETNICLIQFNGIWFYFFWCRFTHGWDPSSRSMGFGYWCFAFFTWPM